MSTENAQKEQSTAQIESNLGLAEHVLDAAAQLVRSTRLLFELEIGDDLVRLRPKTPHEFREAESWILFGRNHLKTIAVQPGEQFVNRSRRAVSMARLVEANVKARLALVFLEYWKGSAALESYEVLAHQALAFSLVVLEDNWEYFAPLVFVHEHEPLDKKNEGHVQHLIAHADAALAYGQCLHAQMLVSPRRMINKYEPVRGPKQVETPVEAAKWPEIAAWCVNRPGATQAEIGEEHIRTTTEDLREKSWVGQRRRPLIYPKQRLVGFANSRGGRKHKRAA